ncbi:hypothetical protein H072_431 [Dactylellina haptotyla CBS 200.50]|uniref:Uncharacterized protein n=1 Tax=Dactylellina haptotyla (strain CBS 200.50) TaxID=1284197 RepID=S8ARH3_DACHA|nr:hypothetical protein H072_431 [Dactylellina haptotyla CBS 200.50]
MGLHRPQRSSFHDLPTPPPSTPLSLAPLPPLASTVNIHITNHHHHHFGIQTPPSTAPRKVIGSKSRAALLSSKSSRKPETKSPLLQRIIQNFSPIYGYLTPAATPAPSPLQITLTGEESTWEDEEEEEFEEQDLEELSELSSDTATIFDDMPTQPMVRFSASASSRYIEDFQTEPASETEAEEEESRLLSPTGIWSPPQIDNSSPASSIAEEDTLTRIFGTLHGATSSKLRLQRNHTKKARQQLPQCYDHDLRLPDEEPGCDVVACDWKRKRNPHRFNNYSAGFVQCRVPKCDVCIAHETYGEKSVWKLSAPKGHTAESHRLRSRIRYLCKKCPQPAPAPPGGIGPVELCTCVLRDGDGIPTDMWFQCKDCAESAWFDFDSKFGGVDGILVPPKRARRKKNKYGIIVRPRKTRKQRLLGVKETRIKRCSCGSYAPSDGRYGAYCTWCLCPVVGLEMMELGGAATKSGKQYMPKSQGGSGYYSEDDVEDEDVVMDEIMDEDSGIAL